MQYSQGKSSIWQISMALLMLLMRLHLFSGFTTWIFHLSKIGFWKAILTWSYAWKIEIDLVQMFLTCCFSMNLFNILAWLKFLSMVDITWSNMQANSLIEFLVPLLGPCPTLRLKCKCWVNLSLTIALLWSKLEPPSPGPIYFDLRNSGLIF